jgi:hypothetical protein
MNINATNARNIADTYFEKQAARRQQTALEIVEKIIEPKIKASSEKGHYTAMFFYHTELPTDFLTYGKEVGEILLEGGYTIKTKGTMGFIVQW